MNEERIAHIEKELTRIRWRGRLGWLTAAAMGLTLLVAARGSSGQLSAERFVLVDANGETRAVLGTDGVNPSLTMFDRGGSTASLSVTGGMPLLSLVNGEGSKVTLEPERTKALELSQESQVTESEAVIPTPEIGLLQVSLKTDNLFTAIDVSCKKSGYRQRAAFLDKVAVLPNVPSTEDCVINFKGGIPAVTNGRGGQQLTCMFDGNQAICIGV